MTTFDNVQELKEFIINEVLLDLAEQAGKPLSEVRKAFESVDYIREFVMDKVYEVSLQVARHQGFKL